MRTVPLLARICAGLMLLAAVAPAASRKFLVYFGTYTGPKSKGIYVATFDPRSGALGPARLAGELPQPSWLVLHPKRPFLYSVSELGNGQASVASFVIDKTTGDLKLLNKVPSGGGGPCHLAVDKAGTTLYVANYNAGSISGYLVESDGTLGRKIAGFQHKGSSVNPQRQSGPHAHAVVLSRDGRFLFVPDLGLDQVFSYRVAVESLTPNEPPFVKVAPGAGPRHFAFHPSAKFAYVIDELNSTVTAFAYDAQNGVLKEIEAVPTLPADYKGETSSAEIEVDRAGKFLYASNRGNSTITVFAIDHKTGKLTNIQNVSTQGKIPRGFQIDPTGRYLVVGNQNSDSVVVFKIGHGKLTPTGKTLEVPSPVCVQFLAVR